MMKKSSWLLLWWPTKSSISLVTASLLVKLASLQLLQQWCGRTDQRDPGDKGELQGTLTSFSLVHCHCMKPDLLMENPERS